MKHEPIAAATYKEWAAFMAAAKIAGAQLDAERTVALGDELMRISKQQIEH